MTPLFHLSLKSPSSSFYRLSGASPLLAGLIALACATSSLSGQDTSEVKKPVLKKALLDASAPSAAHLEAAVAVARERAKLLHDVYSTTLDVMHHRYFRQDGPVLPARAMEDVFEDMEDLSGDKANWISVNTKAMSVNHEPATAFEKKAAAELSDGRKEYEFVGDGVYQRAAVIPLRSSCVSCHTKQFGNPPDSPRFAGLVISIPLKVEKK